MLGYNPMRPELSGTWIIHLLNPKAMIKCVPGHITTTEPFAHFTFRNIKGIEEQHTLVCFFFFTSDFITEPEVQVEPLLKKAWKWYMAYLLFNEGRL